MNKPNFNRRQFISAAAAGLLALGASRGAAQIAAKRPNIIVIITDD